MGLGTCKEIVYYIYISMKSEEMGWYDFVMYKALSDNFIPNNIMAFPCLFQKKI